MRIDFSAQQPAQASGAHRTEALKAGAQFEALLLNNVLGGVEHAFTQLPGSEEQQSSAAYNGLAMQALASKIADSGGIGLARPIAQALLKQSPKTPEKQGPEDVKGF